MGRIGLPELIVILLIVFVIFGANRLPGLGRGIDLLLGQRTQALASNRGETSGTD